MYSSKENENGAAQFFLSWQFLVFKVFVFALITIYLMKPTGSLAGRLAFEEKGFHLYSSTVGGRKVSAVAIGPRGPQSDERGVWVKDDGTFRLDQLPVGEYELRVRAPGFTTEYINDLYVDESKVTQIPNVVRMATLAPSVSVASSVRVYTTKEVPRFYTSLSAAKHVTVKVYQKDALGLQRIADAAGDKKRFYINSDTSFHLAGDESKPVFPTDIAKFTFERDVKPSFEDYSSEQFAFDKALAPGDYVAVADATALDGDKHVYSAMLFTVTNLGLITKKAPDKTLVRAIDMETLKPVEHANITVRLRDPDGAKVSGFTNKDGFVELRTTAELKGQTDLMIVGQFGKFHAYDGMNYWQGANEGKYTTYIYTDRPVYRLGQTVYFKGIVRQNAAAGLKNPGKGVGVTVNIENPENTEIESLSLTTSDHGTFSGKIDIPKDEKTGDFQINVKLPDDSNAYSTFSILQYRKPEFLVEVKPSVPRIAAGNGAEFHIKASYFFGAPVANARVKYNVYSSPDYSLRQSIMPRPKYYSFFDDWEDDDTSSWYSSYGGGGDYENSGYVQTDENGEAVVKFDTKPIVLDPEHPISYYPDQSYKVETEVTDMTRMTVSGSGSVVATPADFELFVNPESYVTRVGDNFNVEVSAVDYEGKPVADQPVELRLVRYMYDRAKGEYKGVDVKSTATAVTGKDGVIKTTFHTEDQWPCDTFYICASSKDKAGHVAYNSSSIWIANEKQPYLAGNEQQAAKQPFEVKLDKSVYQPGDVAKIMVSSPLQGSEGVEAIVSVEGTRIYNYKLVPLTATAQLVEVPIKREYIPNAYISVAFVGKKHQFYRAEKMIRVSPEQNFLNVEVTTDKKKYKPGERAKYTLKATHLDGKPAANTELSLGVVDESIYSVMPDTTENIQKFFYRRRNNWVVTSSSFPEQYSGGPDKAEPRVRKDFRDTAAWFPSLVTDKNGIATASVHIPDNLTTWRATVRGVDTDTDVGSSIQKVTVTQDLIVRLGVPRFFTQDDQGTVSAVVHNYTDQPQSVKVTFSPSPEFSTSVPLIQTLDVKPEKTARFDWPIIATVSGTGTVRVKAVGQTAGDAVEQTIPIRPLGVPAFSLRSGLLTDETANVQIPIGVSADTAPGTAKYNVSLASSTIGPVLGNFDALIDYPYGCTEQTLSRLVPSIVAFKLHKQLGVPISKADRERFDQVYAKAIEKLELYHHGDGGWGWWQNDDSNPYLTSLVIDGLTLLNSCGVYADTHEEWLKSGSNWLKSAITAIQKQMSDPHVVDDPWRMNEYRTDMCFALYTIGQRGKLPAAETDWILKQYEKLTPEGLSYLTLALKKGGRAADAQKVYDRLISLANSTPEFFDWDHTRSMIKKLHQKGLEEEYSYRFTGVETTALGLRTVLKMEPDNSDRIEKIKHWLLLQRDKDGWGNTKTTAHVFEVLLEEELLARSKWPTKFTAEAKLGDKLLKEYSFNPQTSYQPEQTFAIDVNKYLGGKQKAPETLTISKNGTGRLYYTSLLTCFRKMKPGDVVAEKATPSGLKVTRQFLRVVPGPMKSDGSIHFHTQAITDGKIKSGETILMKVLVESPVSIPYVMLEAALPSGAEVVQDSSEQADMENGGEEGPKMEGDWSAPWWSHQDILDDRIVFFGSTLPEGKSEFHTLLRMEIPGKLNVDPVSLEGMYTNKVRGYSQLDGLTVADQ